MNPLVERIHAIYDRHAPRQIHPHIGSAFRSPSEADLRIMAVGINAYVGVHDQGKESPAWFAEWFTNQAYRYQKGVWRDLKALATHITTPPFRFAAKRFAGMDSIYLTNAVKVYLPELTGKRASELTDSDYERHLDQWRDELDAMAEHGALPHVIAIVGDPFWSRACESFRKPGMFTRIKPTRYDWCKGSCRHYLNGITLDGAGGKHELLLLRLRHPAGRASMGSPKWLVEQPEFRAMATESE